jgi:hypothetical protein
MLLFCFRKIVKRFSRDFLPASEVRFTFYIVYVLLLLVLVVVLVVRIDVGQIKAF